MSKQIEAVELLMSHPMGERLLKPAFNRERETLKFSDISYGALSGGEKVFVSWAWVIWEDKQVPHPKVEDDWKKWPGYPMRDPFEGFGVMDRELQQLVLTAFALRHDTFATPGHTEEALRNLAKQISDGSKKH